MEGLMETGGENGNYAKPNYDGSEKLTIPEEKLSKDQTNTWA